jgi:hypothetical protein
MGAHDEVRIYIDSRSVQWAVTESAIAMAFACKQARRASQTFKFAHQIERSEAVAHFTGQFLSLLSGGNPAKLIHNADWAYRFWSLESTADLE